MYMTGRFVMELPTDAYGALAVPPVLVLWWSTLLRTLSEHSLVRVPCQRSSNKLSLSPLCRPGRTEREPFTGVAIVNQYVPSFCDHRPQELTQ